MIVVGFDEMFQKYLLFFFYLFTFPLTLYQHQPACPGSRRAKGTRASWRMSARCSVWGWHVPVKLPVCFFLVYHCVIFISSYHIHIIFIYKQNTYIWLAYTCQSLMLRQKSWSSPWAELSCQERSTLSEAIRLTSRWKPWPIFVDDKHI